MVAGKAEEVEVAREEAMVVVLLGASALEAEVVAARAVAAARVAAAAAVRVAVEAVAEVAEAVEAVAAVVAARWAQGKSVALSEGTVDSTVGAATAKVKGVPQAAMPVGGIVAATVSKVVTTVAAWWVAVRLGLEAASVVAKGEAWVAAEGAGMAVIGGLEAKARAMLVVVAAEAVLMAVKVVVIWEEAVVVPLGANAAANEVVTMVA